MKIIIDPYRGGNDKGQEINGQFEKNILLNLSKKIYNQLKNNNIEAELTRNNDISLTDEERISIINELKDSNDIIIQNRISEDGEFDIIYPLRKSDELASLLTNNIENQGIQVDKYYQRRLPSNTTLDYYYITRNTSPNETIVIEYKKDTDFDKISTVISQTIIDYLNKKNTYTVKKGDSLYQIAKKYNTSVNKIKELNNLKSNNLTIGQIIKIPNEAKGNENIPTNQITYTVQKGDTLYQIAKTYNTTYNIIKELNNLSSNDLYIGQKLKIPSNNQEYTTYIVQKGDSLYQIAKKYNTTVNDIKSINNLTDNLLSIGQKLKIPR